jgi:multidrug resistance protein, MATE family
MSEPVTHARVLRSALPIVAANATVPLLGIVDTAVIGQMGAAAPIGAVGLGAVILASAYWVFGFLRMGTTGLVAQAKGARDPAEVAAVLQRGLLIAAAAGLGLIVVQGPLVAAAFALVPASAEVEGLTRAYLAIRIWGAPATIALYALTGWLIALERSRAVLGLQVAMNGLNIGLSVTLVMGLGWGGQGVALATLISEVAGLALALWLCRSGLRRTEGVFDAPRLRRMAAVNRDILIRSVLLQGAFTTFLFVSAGQGDTVLAANQVLMQFLTLMAYLLDGFAFTAEALVGQSVGARDPARLGQAVWITSVWAAGVGAAVAALYALAGGALVDLVTTAPDVRAAARDTLPWAVLAPLLGWASFQLDGVFIGATRTADLRNAMIVSVGGYAGAVWLLAGWVPHGIWLAMSLLFVLRAVTLGALYPRIPRGLCG